MRSPVRLSLTALAAVALLTLGGCTSKASQTAAEPAAPAASESAAP